MINVLHFNYYLYLHNNFMAYFYVVHFDPLIVHNLRYTTLLCCKRERERVRVRGIVKNATLRPIVGKINKSCRLLYHIGNFIRVLRSVSSLTLVIYS